MSQRGRGRGGRRGGKGSQGQASQQGGGQGSAQGGGQQGGGQGQARQGGQGQRAASRAKGRNRRGARQRKEPVSFWGDPARLPTAEKDVRISEDAAAVVRSLGPPPLPGREQISEHYFEAVYDRAVMVAGALAAAGGLIEPEDLVEEY